MRFVDGSFSNNGVDRDMYDKFVDDYNITKLAIITCFVGLSTLIVVLICGFLYLLRKVNEVMLNLSMDSFDKIILFNLITFFYRNQCRQVKIDGTKVFGRKAIKLKTNGFLFNIKMTVKQQKTGITR